jgi:hypothetical protein
MKSSRSAVFFPGAALASLVLGCSSGPSANPNTLAAPKGIEENVAPPANLGGGTLLLSASGEALALSGFAFPPSSVDATFMVDGWQFTLDRYLTVFEKVTLWDNPDEVPSDQSQHGGVVAEVEGPWVVDLHKGGPLMGKGGAGEEAVPFGAIYGMNDGSSFDPTVTYGFGFSTVAAPKDVYNVNLDAAGLADYQDMIKNGYSVLYVGTATYIGDPSCDTLSSAVPYDFKGTLPPVVNFHMGFSTPTSYVNCQNGTDLSGPGVDGEDHPRGVQLQSDDPVIAQVTIHMDHPFWESFAEDSPLHWDQIAAQYVGVTNPTAQTEDLKGVDFTAFTDKNGKVLPWRSCVDPSYYTPPGTGQMHFDPLSVPVDTKGTDPAKALRDYYDYIRYSQSTQGHLNSQGLCFVSRNFPSPAGGSGG